MGAKSTMYIKREDCLKEIIGRLKTAPDSVLENILEDMVGDRMLHNFVIVHSDMFEEEKENKRDYSTPLYWGGCFGEQEWA